MEHEVKLFVIPKGKTPSGPTNPAREFAVTANDLDSLKEGVRIFVVGEKLRLRSISFGPSNLIAYAEEVL